MMQVNSEAKSDPVYGSNGRAYWLGHSAEHISQEEVFNRYLDTLKPRSYDVEATETTDKSIDWAENHLGAKMWDYEYIPKEKDYPKPFMEPKVKDGEYEETAEITDTLDSIRQAEIQFGYRKEDQTHHGGNFDYYNEKGLTDD